jgi:YtkA-like protein
VSTWRCFALFALALTLGACLGGAQPGYTAQKQTLDGLVITLERPQQAEILKDYDMFVTLNDAGGKPVDGATVFLDITMPTMQMGANQPIGEGLGNGRYRIKGAFTMEGDWRVEVNATVAGKQYKATFDQPVTLQK